MTLHESEVERLSDLLDDLCNAVQEAGLEAAKPIRARIEALFEGPAGGDIHIPFGSSGIVISSKRMGG